MRQSQQQSQQLTRRRFIRNGLAASAAVLGATSIQSAITRGAEDTGEIRRLSLGVHLFLDDDIIASQKDLKRTIHPPQRLPRPLVTGKDDKCFQP